MTPATLKALARTTSKYLLSRNSDINGYWAIGVLCAKIVQSGKTDFGFRIYPGRAIELLGCEIAGSKAVSDKLVRFKLDAVDGWFSFAEDGHYLNGAARYQVTLTLSMRQDRRAGQSTTSTDCWPHNPARERQSSRFASRLQDVSAMTPPLQPLDYAAPTKSRRSDQTALNWLWIPTAVLIAPASYFVPLARHIWSCTSGEAWCMMSGFFCGVPFGAVALAFSTLGIVHLIGAADWRRSWLRWATVLGLLIPPAYMVWLFTAMIHHG